jgi:hypothetical protein
MALASALALLLHDHSPIPEIFADRVASARTILAARREATFPVRGFDAGPTPSWSLPPEENWATLTDFATVSAEVDRELARLTRVFAAVLEIPLVAEASEPVDCPVCETPRALTPDRINAIRRQLTAQEQYQARRRRANTSLQQLTQLANHIEEVVRSSRPAFLSWDAAERARRGFTIDALRTLLADAADQLVPPWQDAHQPFADAVTAVETAAQDLRDAVVAVDLDAFASTAITTLRSRHDTIVSAAGAAVECLRLLQAPQRMLVDGLNRQIDRQGARTGPSRTPIPVQSEHPFRAIRTLIPGS